MPRNGAGAIPEAHSCEVVDCEDGTYLGLFTLPIAPEVTAAKLDIMVNEIPIQGSPFSIGVD